MRILKLLMVILTFSLLVATPVKRAEASLGGAIGGIFVGGLLGLGSGAVSCQDAPESGPELSDEDKGKCIIIVTAIMAGVGFLIGAVGAIDGLIDALEANNDYSNDSDLAFQVTNNFNVSNPVFQVVATSSKAKKPPLFFVKDLTTVWNGKVEPGFGVGINLLAIGRD